MACILAWPFAGEAADVALGSNGTAATPSASAASAAAAAESAAAPSAVAASAVANLVNLTRTTLMGKSASAVVVAEAVAQRSMAARA